MQNKWKALTFQIFNLIIYFQILKLHMVLFKLEMIQANTTLFFTEKIKNKANTLKTTLNIIYYKST